MSDFYEFECGCKFPIYGEIKKCDGLPAIKIDYENIPLDCPKAWTILDEGKTKGVFQLETQLGMSWAKKLQPVSIEEIAALISIIRPGTLKAIVDGKSMTQHFIDRKNGEEEYKDIHPSMFEFLEYTYGVIAYQEQAMQLSAKLAGFDLKKADNLRKAMGKKLADLMAKVRTDFIEGCKVTGIVTDEQANEIFDIIEKSNRYSFNKCLSLDTTVETKDGLKTLDELQIGEMVLAPINDGKNDFVEVVDKVYNGEKELFEVTTESGKVIKCTIDHKLLCEDNVLRPLWEIIQDGWKIMTQDE